MKKHFFFPALILLTFFTGCYKKAYADSKSISSVKNQNKHQNETPKIDPKIKKLETVISKMTPRFLETITKNDPRSFPDEFFSDIEKVLEAEKNFPADDLSLYYLIDKKHKVSSEYEPKNLRPLVKNNDYIINRNDLSLRPDAEDALRILARAAKEDGITLVVSSTYRSYAYQEKTFNKWVQIDGLEEAERESARPGTSQHQLGAAIDFGSIEDDFIETKAGKWLYNNAQDYGWSLSFPDGYEDVTGYRWECWHYRYIGKEACDFQKKWFGNIQQYMFEFLDEWKKVEGTN